MSINLLLPMARQRYTSLATQRRLPRELPSKDERIPESGRRHHAWSDSPHVRVPHSNPATQRLLILEFARSLHRENCADLELPALFFGRKMRSQTFRMRRRTAFLIVSIRPDRSHQSHPSIVASRRIDRNCSDGHLKMVFG